MIWKPKNKHEKFWELERISLQVRHWTARISSIFKYIRD